MVQKSGAKSAPLPTPRPSTKPLAKDERCEVDPKANPLKFGAAKTGPIDQFARQVVAEVVVGKGDTLSAIAGRVLGDENRWEELFEANKDKIRDPHRVAEGLTLRLPGASAPAGHEVSSAPAGPPPALGKDPLCDYTPGSVQRDQIVGAVEEAQKLANEAPETYKVKKGDSLSRIASRVLGDASRWQEILDANADQLKGKDTVVPGMVLKMPEGAKEVLHRRAEEVGEEGPVQGGRLWDMAREIGEKHGVDPRLVMAVVQKESGGNPRARSHVGARGLMQLMPGTARELGVTDSYNARANMDGGTRYLKSLIRDFGDVRLALMAYNWGPGNVRSYLRGRKKPPKETRNYVPAVLAYYRQFGGKA